MIVVVGSAYDVRARRIVEHWGQRSAMLTQEDLCMPGWRLTIPPRLPLTAVVGGRIVPSADIQGILVLRPCIFPEELQNIHRDHRKYVAAELNAFLLAWLAAQSCPVLNRPTACCLGGPNWRAEQWTRAAMRLGIPAHTRRSVPNGTTSADTEESLELITVGERCFGCNDSSLKESALKLARAAGVELLSVRFSRDQRRFLSANAWPSLLDAAVLDAVRERLEAHL
ncbi:MAG: hypothetical protein ACJ74Y_16845 [Bryobacteraceae bacterium]